MSSGGNRWVYVRETIFALAVMALVFLNFGHVAVTASGAFQVTPDSWCGDPMVPGGDAHAPCHACRVGGAALPPPPAEAAPVCFEVARVIYGAPLAAEPERRTHRPILPRGPPISV